MRRPTRIQRLSLMAAGAGLTLLLTVLSLRTPKPTSTSDASLNGRPKRASSCFEVEWTTSESRLLGKLELPGKSYLKGTLCHRREQFWLEEIGALDLELLGKRVEIPRKALVRNLFELQWSGGESEVRLRSSAKIDSGAEGFARSLLLAFRSLPTEAGERKIPTSLGVRVDTVTSRESGKGIESSSTHGVYLFPASLAGHAPSPGMATASYRIDDREKRLVEGELVESVDVPGVTKRTEKLSVRRIEKVAPLPVGKPQETLASSDARSALEARASGMTLSGLQSQLAAWPGALTGRAIGKFLFQASALLQLHPKYAAELVSAALSEDWGVDAQNVLSDLLRGAGTPECQRALWDLVDGGNDRKALIQRIGLVEEPTEETVRKITERLQGVSASLKSGEVDQELATATEFAAGSSARQLRTLGRAEEADRLVSLLVDYLADANTPVERARLIRALGNAGAGEMVLEATSSKESVERAAAATALRFASAGAETDALLALVSDSETEVQHAALVSLEARGFLAEDASAVAQAVLDGSMKQANLLASANVLLAQEDISPYRAALGLIAQRADGLPRLRARISDRLAE